MRDLLRSCVPALLALCSSVVASATVVGSALVQFDHDIRNYNLISFGDASFTRYGDTEGGLAVAGKLTLDGGTIAAQPGKFGLTSDPTLYVGGGLKVYSEARLQSGYASLAASPNSGWSWNAPQNRLTSAGSTFSTVNTPHPRGDIDPRLNPGPAGWNFASLYTSFVGISQTLASATGTGLVEITGQTLRFKAPAAGAHGAIVFDFDANLLSGSTYAGQFFSNIQFDVPAETAYVINVRNAAGRTLFGSTGINFNSGSGYDRLLWNIVDATPNTTETVRFGNGGQFFGAVLAPTFNVFNDLGAAVNGQVVAGSYAHAGAELHYTGFNFHEEFDYEVPEPGTYGLLGAAACAGLALARRRRHRAPAPVV